MWPAGDSLTRSAGSPLMIVCQCLVGQGDGLLGGSARKPLDQRLVPGEADLQGVFQDQRQQHGGGLAADRSARLKPAASR
jgi:hypothetical protein